MLRRMSAEQSPGEEPDHTDDPAAPAPADAQPVAPPAASAARTAAAGPATAGPATGVRAAATAAIPAASVPAAAAAVLPPAAGPPQPQGPPPYQPVPTTSSTRRRPTSLRRTSSTRRRTSSTRRTSSNSPRAARTTYPPAASAAPRPGAVPTATAAVPTNSGRTAGDRRRPRSRTRSVRRYHRARRRLRLPPLPQDRVRGGVPGRCVRPDPARRRQHRHHPPPDRDHAPHRRPQPGHQRRYVDSHRTALHHAHGPTLRPHCRGRRGPERCRALPATGAVPRRRTARRRQPGPQRRHRRGNPYDARRSAGPRSTRRRPGPGRLPRHHVRRDQHRDGVLRALHGARGAVGPACREVLPGPAGPAHSGRSGRPAVPWRRGDQPGPERRPEIGRLAGRARSASAVWSRCCCRTTPTSPSRGRCTPSSSRPRLAGRSWIWPPASSRRSPALPADCTAGKLSNSG